MSEGETQTPAQKLIGDFAPKLVSLTDDVLLGDIWARNELLPRDRSLITVAALIANGSTEQLPGHLARARDNGLSEEELKEVRRGGRVGERRGCGAGSVTRIRRQFDEQGAGRHVVRLAR